MKKILLIVLLTLGLYPVLDHGKLEIAVTRTMADSWGDEGGWDDGWIEDDIYSSMSDVFGMDIVGSSEWMGHTVFNLADGSIWDPSAGNLDEVEITALKEDVIDAFPEIFIPDTPEADPESYPSLQDLVDYLEETNQQAKDLWKRDKDGKLLKEPTGMSLERQYGTEYVVEYKEFKIKIRNDIEVIAYEVVKVKDLATNQYFTEIPDRFKSNCTGYAFVKGDMWLFDSPINTSNESAAFENMLKNGDLFSNTAKENANVAVIWWTDPNTGESFIAHSAIVNSDGTYTQKDSLSEVNTVDTENDFKAGHDSDLHTVEVKYYKRNF